MIVGLTLGGVLIALALLALRWQTREAGNPWLRMALLAFLMLTVTGFGLCGAWGAGLGLTMLIGSGTAERGWWPVFVVPGLVGLALAGLIYWLTQKARRPRPPAEES